MKLKSAFKVGVFTVIVILVSWWGIKWLGGQNIFLTNNSYYVYFDDVTGLQESSRVKMRGVEVGNVRSITLMEDKVKVEIAIDADYEDMIPDNSIAEIASAGLMGGMEIYIIQGDSETSMPDGGTFEGRVRPDMLGSLADKGGELLDGLNVTVENLNTLLEANSENIGKLVANLESVTASIDEMLTASSDEIEGALGDLHSFTTMLSESSADIQAMITNLESFSGDLADADIVEKLNTTVESLNGVLSTIENAEGSVGKLLNDTELYDSLTTASDNLGLLLEDVKARPMRYVNISVFGKSPEKIEEKAAKKAAKEAEKAAKRAAKESK
ncbi:MAG: MCE family protein [Alistipes sp.]|nr:MCE family protein [Alistipes sp.]